jgi:bacillithiol system protein YtxJ
MQFLALEREEQLEEISEAKKPQVILKHNTTCPISKGVLRSLNEEASTLPADTPFYILDILTYRNISDTIEKKFSVPHESPQLLLIKDGKCTYNQSLYNITPEETVQAIHENE